MSEYKDTFHVTLSDFELLREPLLNKGSAFPWDERVAFNLLGLLPSHIGNLEIQCKRSYQTFSTLSTPLDKYVYLRSLQDSNETLFYALLQHHIAEMFPIIYTPTVGQACQHFSAIYRRPRGLFLSPNIQDKFDQILANPYFDHVEAIVVSDGERILGLGDQGAGGMGIPIGKLSLYTACAGIHPRHTLPILLDVGTNNPALLDDPLYVGYRHPRIQGEEYDCFIDTFVQAVKRRFPNVLLQWEDFAQGNAHRLLEKYRNEICSFNDDIQGTAAVAVAALLAAVDVTNIPLTQKKIVILGAGSAGCGIAELLVNAMMYAGLSEEKARERFFLIKSDGLLRDDMAKLQPFQKKFARSAEALATLGFNIDSSITLKEVVETIHPTVLIGVSGQHGAFSEDIIRHMAANTPRPIIFPLSNPNSHAEATPDDLMQWTDGRALIGTGSPFPLIKKHGKDFRVDQTNNNYVFPGMGLGVIACKAKCITDSMFMVAAQAVADLSPAKKDKEANLLPPLHDIRDISFHVALAVAKEACHLGLSPLGTPSEETLVKAIRDTMWEPTYVPYHT